MKWDYYTYLQQPTFFIKELMKFVLAKYKAQEKALNGRRNT